MQHVGFLVQGMPHRKLNFIELRFIQFSAKRHVLVRVTSVMKIKGNIIRVHVGTFIVNMLVGVGASLVVSFKVCKLVCNRLAKAEDIIRAFINFRAAISKTLSNAIRTATRGEGIEDRLLPEELGAGGRHSALM